MDSVCANKATYWIKDLISPHDQTNQANLAYHVHEDEVNLLFLERTTSDCKDDVAHLIPIIILSFAVAPARF